MVGDGEAQIINGVVKARITLIQIHRTRGKDEILNIKADRLITGLKEATGKRDKRT